MLVNIIKQSRFRLENSFSYLKADDNSLIQDKNSRMEDYRIKTPNSFRCFMYGSFALINIILGVTMIIEGALWKRIHCDIEELSHLRNSPNQFNLVALYMIIQGVVLDLCTVISHGCVIDPLSYHCCGLFCMIWFSTIIWGSYFIFSWVEKFHETSYNCDPKLLWFAFGWLIYGWLQTIVYVGYAIFVLQKLKDEEY